MDKIQKLLNNYVKSVNECNVELVHTLWDDKEPVSFIHPLGYEHDFDEIKNHFYLGIMGGKFSKRDLKLKDVKTKIYNDTAFLEFSWDFYAVSKETGENIHGRETQFLVFRDMM